jgi:DNA-binding Xre family transcriptional regulator
MMKNGGIYEKKAENGMYRFKLYKILAEKGISQNRFMREAPAEFTTMKNYATGNIQRIDIYVIDRWCQYLKCEFEDIIEYKK